MRIMDAVTSLDSHVDRTNTLALEDPDISKELERSFEDMLREINHLIDQMTEDERKAYLLESLFLNTVKYENDKLETYMRKIAK